MMRIALSLVALMALAACGDKPQTTTGSRRDVPVFEGTSNPYNAPGWKAGDKKAWEQQLRARGQYGQNEYTRVN
ncbi:MAG: hypothetical protein V4731_14420 [Pseudomonadota bacterium]